MGFPSLKWVECLLFIAADDFYPKISVLQLLLKIYGATWDQSKYIFSLLCKLGFCATYALHPYTLSRNSCPSKGGQPLDCAVRPGMRKNRIVSQWLTVVWFSVFFLISQITSHEREDLSWGAVLTCFLVEIFCTVLHIEVFSPLFFFCVPHNLGFPLVCWRTTLDYFSLLKA